MADSLGVPAVKKWYALQGEAEFPNRTVVRDALLAGSDLLPLIEFYADPARPGWRDNQLPTIQDSILYMREQYVSDPAFRRRADDAVRRVLEAKIAAPVAGSTTRWSTRRGIGGREAAPRRCNG
jgi:hypothetical protein